MSIEGLPDDLREFAQRAIDRGQYRTLDELLVEGLRVLREREAFLFEHRESLRDAIAGGAAQADRGGLVDGEQAMERLRRDLAASPAKE
jgi:putative addiction module CopG family antidote